MFRKVAVSSTVASAISRRGASSATLVACTNNLFGASSFSAVPSSIGVSTATAYRFYNSTTQQETTKVQQPLSEVKSIENSPVDIETFTLDEDMVEVHMNASRKWREWADSLDAAKAGKTATDAVPRREAVVQVLAEGRALFKEVGVNDSPVNCDVMLCLEEAQAFTNIEDYSKALQQVEDALKLVGSQEKPDVAQMAEMKEFRANIYLRSGDFEKSKEQYESLLQWIDVDSTKEQPMVTVAAKNMRRTVKSGIGLSLEAKASAERDRAGWNAALDILVDALNAHIEEKDVVMVKVTLEGAMRCFENLNDKKQAIMTARKFIKWCRDHDDLEGVAQGEKKYDALVEKFGPLE